MRKPIHDRRKQKRGLTLESLEDRVVLATVPFQDDLALWLDADVGVTTSGSEVTDWADQSGNGNDLTLLTTGPDLVTDALNGNAILKFDGIDDGLGRSGFTGLPIGAAERSVFFVANYIGGPGWGGVSYGSAMDNEAFGLVTSGGLNGKLTVQGWGISNDYRSSVVGFGAGWLGQSAIVDGGTVTHYLDGTEIDSDAHVYATTSDRIRVGVELDDNRHMDMEIAEILVYDRALSPQEKAQVDAYIRLEYFGENTLPTTTDDIYDITRSGTIDTTLDGLPGVLDNDFDPNLDAMTAVLGTPPLRGTLTLNPDGSFEYIHGGTGAAVDSFTYFADDGFGSSVETTVTINITNPNAAPVALDDGYAVTNGGSYDSGVLGQSVLDNDSDADFDALTATLVDPPTAGTLTLNPDGTFVYDHDGSGAGTDTFTYRANDGTDDSNLATVTMTINDANTLPVAEDDFYQTESGGTIDTVVDGLPSVLANDVDVDNDILRAVLIDAPTHGTLTLNSDGSFVYAHGGSSELMDSFTYEADDGTGRSNLATVTISLATAPPVTTGLVMRLDADFGVATSGTDVVTWTDIGGSGNDLSVTDGTPQLVDGALNGRSVVRFDGVDDALGRTGAINLPQGNSDRTVFMVANYVSGVWSGFTFGDPIDNQAFGLISAGGVAGRLTVQGWGLANDYRSTTVGVGAGWLVQSAVVENDELTHFKDGQEIDSNSQVYATSDGRIRLGAELDDNRRMAMDVAEILVYDRALSQSEIQMVEAYLQTQYFGDNTAPIAMADAYTLGRGDVLDTALDGADSVLVNDSDADGDTLTAQLVTGPDHGSLTLNPDGSFVYTHDGSAVTSDSFTYRAFDGLAASNDVVVDLTIENEAPVGLDDDYAVALGGAIDTAVDGLPSVLDNDTDGDSDSLTAVLVSGPAHGTLTLNPDGSFIYENDGNANTEDSFTYVADDGLATSPDITVTIALQDVGIPGDFDADGVLGCGDLDLLGDAILAADHDPAFDLNEDSLVDALDQETWILDLYGTLLGDANLDFVVDVTDFNIWNTVKFTGGIRWCGGNFNGDDVADISDFNVWNENKFSSVIRPADLAAEERVTRPPQAAGESTDSDQFADPSSRSLATWQRSTYTETERRDSAKERRAVVDLIWSADRFV